MATILAFTPRKTASGAFPAPLAKAGDLIIFPGVRYEREGAGPQADETVRADDRAPDAGNEPRH